MNIACGIEYDGTSYHGFQRQPAGYGATVQGELEKAITRISHQPAVINGAGRTDAGVHASGQVIHFHSSSTMPTAIWVRALNAVLPNSVAVRWAKVVPERFHARFSAVSRSYRYTIWNDKAPTALHTLFSYHCERTLDVDLMHAACSLLLGNQDFGAFGHSPRPAGPMKTEPQSCVRTMLQACCSRPEASQRLIYCDFTANAFLTGQVRRMVGTLLLVGQKRLCLDEFATILQRAEKTHPGTAAPPHGLCLVRVEYPENFGVNEQ